MNATEHKPSALPFTDLQAQYRALKSHIDARIQRVLDHGQYIMGPEVRELEARLSAFVSAQHCITVASGTEALLISLMALDLRPGDEVITTDFSFAATPEVIALLGATPVFADVEADTGNLDASQIERCITPRTRAIVPVSLYGLCADMDAINEIAQRHRLIVIEDAAQSFGATYKGRRSCNLSTIGCTSFFPSKPLGCYGDGGAIFTNDDRLAQACREIRVHGQSGRYHHTRVGVGGRMDTLQCAVVLAKLDRFEWELNRRNEIAVAYRLALARVPGIRLLAERPNRVSAWAQFSVLADRRQEMQDSLARVGIPTAVHYPKPLHLQPAFERFGQADDCPVSRSLAERVLSLPMSADLGADQLARVAAAVEESASALR